MAKTDLKTIDEYISTFPKEIQVKLEKVRQTIREGGLFNSHLSRRFQQT